MMHFNVLVNTIYMDEKKGTSIKKKKRRKLFSVVEHRVYEL